MIWHSIDSCGDARATTCRHSFLYLALQESGFDAQRGRPENEVRNRQRLYGSSFRPRRDTTACAPGPLVELPRHDPMDDRFDAQRSTDAAARYLRDIYYNEAQASGLLVIASYNWGPTNIRKRISQMPENPRDRNFWRLLEQHDTFRNQTYDYVFYIVSAIVIGEDPALFGFDFENPLKAGVNRGLILHFCPATMLQTSNFIILAMRSTNAAGSLSLKSHRLQEPARYRSRLRVPGSA